MSYFLPSFLSFRLFSQMQLYLTHIDPSPLSSKWNKMIAPTMTINTALDFFEPIRRTAMTSLLGYLPIVNARGAVVTLPASDDVESHDVQSALPMVTYISRQGGGRRLNETDHEGLVQALRDLEKEGVCEVNVVQMEKMNVKEQVAVAARTTVGRLLFSSNRWLIYLFCLWVHRCWLAFMEMD
jgi:hypothetical protein